MTKNEMQYYSWFDAAKAYWSVLLRKGDELKTGFTCPYGQFCYKRMGQGLKNAFATFSRLRDIMCGPLPQLPELTGSEEIREEARRRGRPPEGFQAESGITGNDSITACGGMVDDKYIGAALFQAMIGFSPRQIFPPLRIRSPLFEAIENIPVFQNAGICGTAKGARRATTFDAEEGNHPEISNTE